MEKQASILPPCKVCGGKATGLHFGAITCEACKAFYKRSRGRRKPYKCRGKVRGTCEVRFDVTTMCPYCRHLKVVAADMSEEGIHRGRCPADRKVQLLIEAKEIELENENRRKSENSKPAESVRIGEKRGIQSSFDRDASLCDDNHNAVASAKLSSKPGDSFLDLDSFLTVEFKEEDIIKMADLVAQADKINQLYKTCASSTAESRTRRHGEEHQVKESLVGPLRPLSHEEYTEIYKLTGIDIDDYRAKARIIQYMKADIDTYIDFLKDLPGYKDLNLHDRITVAKGGFAGWLVLSAIRVYSRELNAIGIVYDILWSSSDFVRYIGKEFSEGMKLSLSSLLKNSATPPEIALLKAMHIFTVRPEYGIIHNTPAVQKRHQVFQDALKYVVRNTRSPDETTWVLKELIQTLEPLDLVAKSFRQGVSQWPTKFPEYSCPRILQEIVGQQCEEELLVAVSVQLTATHL